MKWNTIIEHEKKKEYFVSMQNFLEDEYKSKKIYPSKDKIYTAFDLCALEEVKVVILGQDPYHQPFQAQGLAFSTPASIKNPPSMVNIIKEIIGDIGDCDCLDGDLTPWAKQGVLLINTVLTVEDSNANSHKEIGWQTFTDNIIKEISSKKENIIFILWGTAAIKKEIIIDRQKHHIISSVHPSPLSSYRGFFGSKPFSKTNTILKSLNKKEIFW